MSPIAKFSAAPQPAPDPAGPEVVAPEPRTSGGRKWLVLVFVLVAVAAAGALFLRVRQASKQPPLAGVRTAKAVRGLLQNKLRMSGTIEAAHYADIVVPRLLAPDNGRGMVLLYLPPNGSMVKAGEKVSEVDGQDAKDHTDDVQAQVNQGELDLLRVKANQAAQMESVRQRVREARGALEKAQQNVRAAPTKNRIDQELLKLAVDEAQANYEAAQGQVELYLESQASAMLLAQYNQERQVRHLNRHLHDNEQLVMKAPMAGRAVLRPTYRHGEQFQVRIGDEVTAGQTLMRIVDASEMRLEASMNQAESELVRIGQRALIRFDAYPDIRLNGHVDAVGTIAAGGRRVSYYIRRVAVRIAIEDTDSRVLPDLTASADVVVAEQPDSIIVPRQAVLEEDGKSVVYVKQAGAFSAREVEVGLASNTEVSIRSGLQAGDEVALERPI